MKKTRFQENSSEQNSAGLFLKSKSKRDLIYSKTWFSKK